MAVELRGVSVRFGDATALDHIDLAIAPGCLVALLGPSGSGKTTALRVLAGLVRPTAGDVYLGGRRVTDIPASERDQGMVFENYALFPRQDVFDNVAFGVAHRGLPQDRVNERVRDALARVRLPGREHAMPAALSRGQQQCVALARALAMRPALWLLDDPFAAMDDRLRSAMRREFRHFQRECGITTVFATHDQAEALAVSDRVVVMNRGHVEQVDSPETVYNQPASAFVAGFLGQSNILPGTIVGQSGEWLRVRLGDGVEIRVRPSPSHDWHVDGPVQLVLRAERLQLAGDHPAADGRTVLDARITSVEYRGASACYGVAIGELSLEAINPVGRHAYRQNAHVKACIDADDCTLLPAVRG